MFFTKISVPISIFYNLFFGFEFIGMYQKRGGGQILKIDIQDRGGSTKKKNFLFITLLKDLK